jgi:transposase
MVSVLEDEFGLVIRKQSLDERFNSKCLRFVEAVLKELLEERFIAQSRFAGKIWDDFPHVRVKDSTKFKIPDQLQEHFKGNGGSVAGMCIQYEYDLKTGKIFDLTIHSGEENDLKDAKETCDKVNKNDLILRDLGYYSIAVFKAIADKEACFLSRLKSNTTVYSAEGTVVSFQDLYNKMIEEGITHYEFNGQIGEEERLPVRILLNLVDDQIYEKRVREREKANKKRGGAMTQETRIRYRFTIFITNASETALPNEVIFAAYKLRWQVELNFKIWKSMLHIDKIHKMKENRFLCLICAKLILMVINQQIAFHIQKEMGIWDKDGKSQLLSLNKVFRTLNPVFIRLYAALRKGKRAANIFFLCLKEKLRKNHFLERRKNKLGFNEIIELFYCQSKKY